MDERSPPVLAARPEAPPGEGWRLSLVYDRLDRWRKRQGVRNLLATTLIVVFVGTLVMVELKRQGWLPPWLARFVSTSHFVAIGIAFYLLVLEEVVGLIFGLAESVARSVGKQVEILSLILLRQSFEVLSEFVEPIRWDIIFGSFADSRLLDLIANALAALLVFILVGYYYRIQHQQPISQDSRDQSGFVAAKKVVALMLLIGFAIVIVRGAVAYVELGGKSSQFFEEAFSLLIFSDVLIVLIALRYSASYRVVFRNSAFALATVLIRLSLTAPAPTNALLGVSAALYAVGLTLAYNKFALVLKDVKPALQGVED